MKEYKWSVGLRHKATKAKLNISVWAPTCDEATHKLCGVLIGPECEYEWTGTGPVYENNQTVGGGDDPGRDLIAKGYTSFSLSEIVPPPPVPPEAHVSTEGRLTLSVAEAAKELGICSRNVYNLCHRADFPTVRIGQRVRISRAGLAEWVRAQEQNRARA